MVLTFLADLFRGPFALHAPTEELWMILLFFFMLSVICATARWLFVRRPSTGRKTFYYFMAFSIPVLWMIFGSMGFSINIT